MNVLVFGATIDETMSRMIRITAITSKSLILCFICQIDGAPASSNLFLSKGISRIRRVLRGKLHFNHNRLRGGVNFDAESLRASHLGPDDALHQPIPKAAIDFRIRTRKKITNKAGKLLKRKWIGGAPIPKAQLRQEEELRRAEKNAAYARVDFQQDERLPTAKVDICPGLL